MAKSPALGKGVEALIQPRINNNSNKSTNNTKNSQSYEVIDIEVSKISLNPFQPRKEFDKIKLIELKDSILKHGLMNPITVKEIIGGYELIAGERRLRAWQLAGFTEIPARVIPVASNAEQLEKALIENIQREDLNSIELAESYQQLIEEFNYTQEQLAERVGKERSTVANFIRLLKLPKSVQELVLAKRLSMGHARALLSLEDSNQIIAVANDIVSKELSVRMTESLIRNILSDKILISKEGKKKTISNKQIEITTEEQAIIEEIQGKLRTILGTNIRIFTKNNNSGTIEIEFYSADDFERIVELITNKQ